MNIGDLVRVLAPFSETYADTYTITDVIVDGETTIYILGELGGFDASYVEAA